MEFIDVIHARCSIRTFSDKEIDDDTLRSLFECARIAPSWMNKQCWRFIVIRNKETIAMIAKTNLINRWLRRAPILIIACADPTESGSYNNIDYFAVDVAIALEHFILAATNHGLGSCWIGEFNEQKVKEILEIPKRIRVVALTPLGYPAGKKSVTSRIATTLTKGKKRKSLAEILHYEHW